MAQSLYKLNEKYIRVRETGSIYPVHVEQLKLIKAQLADLVQWDGKQFVRLDMAVPKDATVKIVSTPARKPETPTPIVQRTFAAPGESPQNEAFAPPEVNTAAPSEVALAAAQAAAVANPPLPQVQRIDLNIEPPPEA